MKLFTALVSVIALSTLMSSSAIAAPSESVFHSHSGRIHQHPLPVEGLSHRHGGGAQGVVAKSTNQAGTIKSTVVYGADYQTPEANNGGFAPIDNQRVFTKKPRDPRQPQVKTQRPPAPASTKYSYTKGDKNCRAGEPDCNVCAVNVQQQFKKASAGQIDWRTLSWNFTWPKSYPPGNTRPLDIFDGDAAYALGIPNTHTQGFVRTNSSNFPFVGSHSHKKKGGIFVVGNTNGKLSLSSLHPTKTKHPSGVHVFGKYIIYGEGNQLIFKDLNSPNRRQNYVFTLPKAKFGGGIGAYRLSKDNYMLVTSGPGGQKSGPRYHHFYHLRGSNGRPVSLKMVSQSQNVKPASWTSTLGFSENLSVITECGTGDVYTVHTTGEEKGVKAISGNGYWRLSALKSRNGKLELSPISAFSTRQNMSSCNIRASATVHVNSQRKLEFYCHGYAKDPDGSTFNVLGKSSRNNDNFRFKRGVVR